MCTTSMKGMNEGFAAQRGVTVTNMDGKPYSPYQMGSKGQLGDFMYKMGRHIGTKMEGQVKQGKKESTPPVLRSLSSSGNASGLSIRRTAGKTRRAQASSRSQSKSRRFSTR